MPGFMIIYNRNIDKKLLSLRLSFFILGLICFFAFNDHHESLGYIIIVALLSMSGIVVKNFIVSYDSLQISTYYFFGLINRTWQFNKGDNIKISSFSLDFEEDDDIASVDDGGSGIGCLFFLFSSIIPPKITRREFKIEKFDLSNQRLKRVHILLDRYEYKCLQKFISES